MTRSRPRQPKTWPEMRNIFPWRKVSPVVTILLNLLILYSALAALPALQELFVDALFAIDAHVITIPDTTLGSTLRSLLPFETLSWNARPLLTAGLTEWERTTPGEILYGCPRREFALCRRLFSKVPCWRLARSLRSSGLKQRNARALRWESRTKHWDSRILCSPETETRATAACRYIYMPRPSVPVSIL